MKLIRNTTEDGSCKYALIRMEALTEGERLQVTDNAGKPDWLSVDGRAVLLGNESPSDQFFVLKYKDKFTAAALWAYAMAVRSEAQLVEGSEHEKCRSLIEYAEQIEAESEKAREQGVKIPD